MIEEKSTKSGMADLDEPVSAIEGGWQTRYRQALDDHVVKAWFPRCIDREFGGFLCDFDQRWQLSGRNEKRLEFQARQTLTAAELFMASPSDTVLLEATKVGFSFLRNVMWDREYGGWYTKTDRRGQP